MTWCRQKGAALLIAVFLIVVIALVGSTVALRSSSQQLTSGRSLEATRGLYAARAKLDREIANVVTEPGAPSSCPAAAGSPNTDFTTTREQCTAVPVDERGPPGDDYTVFFLRVSAEKGRRDAGTKVQRELEAVVTNKD